MLTLLLAAAALPTAVDAERAFARDAQRRGQWIAFRAYAHRDAVMFTPQAVWAHEFLKGRKDPPKSVELVAGRKLCLVRRADRDQHGPVADRLRRRAWLFHHRLDARKGRWRWVYDGGDGLDKPLPAPGPRSERPPAGACQGARRIVPPPNSRFGQSRQAARRLWPRPIGRSHLGWDWKVDAKGGAAFPGHAVDRPPL